MAMTCELSGMIRIGQWDEPVRRRSLWARVLPPLPPEPEDAGSTEMSPAYAAWLDAVNAWRPASVELCAGREGDDAFVRLEEGQPGFKELVEVVQCAIGNLPDEVK